VFSSAIISIAIVWVDDKLEKNKSKRGVIKKEKADKRGFSFYAPLFIILFYSVRTVIRNNDFRNSKNLWIATRKTAPYSYRVYNNMGDVLANEGDLEGALENFKISVALKPDYADAVHNIGHIYMVEGNFPLAKKYLEKSLEMNPRLYPSAYKLGIIYAEEGEYEKSKEYFEQCLKYEPTDADCNNGLQRVLQAIGRK
jgi:tetratricopeptide (TPR) repeat protein